MLQIVDFAVTSASLRPFIVAIVTDGVLWEACRIIPELKCPFCFRLLPGQAFRSASAQPSR
jgi:hypothetical protein